MLRVLLLYLSAFFRSRHNLGLTLAAMQQQMIVLHRSRGRRRLTFLDKAFWVLLRCGWPRWKEALLIVKPATVLKWHRMGFKRYWRWKSRGAGRPKIAAATIALIKKMSRENPGWGEDRIEGELRKLGIKAAPSTIRKYKVKHVKPPSPTWRIFLRSHADQIWACDFFTVHTIFFKPLHVFFFIGHDRRKIVHVGVTSAPSSEWTARQYMNAILRADKIPRFLLRDRDGRYGAVFKARSEHCGTRNLIAPRRAPKFNAVAERLVRTVRRECLDHILVLGEAHLLRILREYAAFYNFQRPHQGIGQKTPIPKKGAIRKKGRIVSVSVLGGIQHHYERQAA